MQSYRDAEPGTSIMQTGVQMRSLLAGEKVQTQGMGEESEVKECLVSGRYSQKITYGYSFTGIRKLGNGT